MIFVTTEKIVAISLSLYASKLLETLIRIKIDSSNNFAMRLYTSSLERMGKKLNRAKIMCDKQQAEEIAAIIMAL